VEASKNFIQWLSAKNCEELRASLTELQSIRPIAHRSSITNKKQASIPRDHSLFCDDIGNTNLGRIDSQVFRENSLYSDSLSNTSVIRIDDIMRSILELRRRIPQSISQGMKAPGSTS
jgi:hypothetical protein